MRIVVTASSCEGGSGKHCRSRAGVHTSCRVSNFLWLLCIPMDGGRLEMHIRVYEVFVNQRARSKVARVRGSNDVVNDRDVEFNFQYYNYGKTDRGGVM